MQLNNLNLIGIVPLGINAGQLALLIAAVAADKWYSIFYTDVNGNQVEIFLTYEDFASSSYSDLRNAAKVYLAFGILAAISSFIALIFNVVRILGSSFAGIAVIALEGLVFVFQAIAWATFAGLLDKYFRQQSLAFLTIKTVSSTNVIYMQPSAAWDIQIVSFALVTIPMLVISFVFQFLIGRQSGRSQANTEVQTNSYPLNQQPVAPQQLMYQQQPPQQLMYQQQPPQQLVYQQQPPQQLMYQQQSPQELPVYQEQAPQQVPHQQQPAEPVNEKQQLAPPAAVNPSFSQNSQAGPSYTM